MSCSYMIAAEQKARTTYDNILRLVKDDPDVCAPIKFLRAREVVHFQRFGEANREDCSKSEHTKHAKYNYQDAYPFIKFCSKKCITSVFYTLSPMLPLPQLSDAWTPPIH